MTINIAITSPVITGINVVNTITAAFSGASYPLNVMVSNSSPRQDIFPDIGEIVIPPTDIVRNAYANRKVITLNNSSDMASLAANISQFVANMNGGGVLIGIASSSASVDSWVKNVATVFYGKNYQSLVALTDATASGNLKNDTYQDISTGNVYSWNGTSLTKINGSTDADLAAIQLIGYDRITGDTPGAFANGLATDSGLTYTTGGAGYADVRVDPTSNFLYTPAGLNTYIMVNVGQAVRRVTEYFSGDSATLAIMDDSSLGNMIHWQIASGSPGNIEFWKVGVGTGQSPAWQHLTNIAPNINNGAIHKLELELIDNFAFGYIDGVLAAVAYSTYFPSLTGNWIMAGQEGSANHKFYGFDVYAGANINSVESLNPDINASKVLARVLEGYSVNIGDVTSAYYKPISSSYFFCNDASQHVFDSDALTTVNVIAQRTGYSAQINIESFLNVALNFSSDGSGNGNISQNGVNRILFPFNRTGGGGINFPNIPRNSGSAPSGAQSGDLWVDTGAGNVLKVV